jgi:phosphate transport system substrate-binding protein
VRTIAATVALVLFAATFARADDVVQPAYQPARAVSGVIRVWGNDQMSALVQRWERGFRKYHPEAQFETKLGGSDIGMAGLYTGLADIALLGREGTASEVKAFEWIFRYKPAQVEILTGSLDGPGKSPALVAFVHKDNPLSRLTLAQLDAIFGHEHLRGAPHNIRTWGQLGLRGEWADKTINLYATDAESGTGRFFRYAVLGDSRKMNWEHLTEFKDESGVRGAAHDAHRRILAKLAADRYGIAVASMPAGSRTQVKSLLLAPADDADYVAATPENLVSRRYPLTRSAFAYLNRKPGAPVDANVAQFLLYVLSREGQQDVVDGGDYLPLNEETARAQSQKLK